MLQATPVLNAWAGQLWRSLSGRPKTARARGQRPGQPSLPRDFIRNTSSLAHPRPVHPRAIKVYAAGHTTDGEDAGTRVASVLAQLHTDLPDESSDAIEQIFKETFTRPLEDDQDQQKPPVLTGYTAEYHFASPHLSGTPQKTESPLQVHVAQ